MKLATDTGLIPDFERYSESVMPYLSFILGRLRTSAISSRIGSETITSNNPCTKASLSLAGYPDGLSKDETQILVSITALTGIFLVPGFSYSFFNVGLYFFGGILTGLFLYFLNKAIKSFLPFISGKYFYPDFFMFRHIDFFKRLENTVFINGINGFRHLICLLISKVNEKKGVSQDNDDGVGSDDYSAPWDSRVTSALWN